MNTDRFLTRVWDKYRQLMSYINDDIYCLGNDCDFIIHDMITKKPEKEFMDKELMGKFLGVQGNKLLISFVEKIGILYPLSDSYMEDRFIPMQCTTLQAKGGEMIYEGDILKVDWGSERNTDILKPLNKPFVMEFRHSSWFPFCHALPFQENIEIIGNIREHPALLEENK